MCSTFQYFEELPEKNVRYEISESEHRLRKCIEVSEEYIED